MTAATPAGPILVVVAVVIAGLSIERDQYDPRYSSGAQSPY